MVICFQGKKAVMQWQLLFSKIPHYSNFADLKETKTFTLLRTGLLSVAIYFCLLRSGFIHLSLILANIRTKTEVLLGAFLLKGGNNFFAL